MIVGTPTDASRYDAIVVGSGPAGTSVAVALEEGGKRCLVIESGGWTVDTEPQDAATVLSLGSLSGGYWSNHWIRAVGGTSHVWGGWVLPNPGPVFESWPISRRDLDPYYESAATSILDRPLRIMADPKQVLPGFVYSPFSLSKATRFAEKYERMFTSSARVDIVTGTTVAGLEANEGRSRITGLVLRTPGGGPARLRIDGQPVVIACGGIGNAHLMLQPAPAGGPPVGNESGVVGRYLMEHPHVYGAGEVLLRADIGFDGLMPAFGDRVHAIAAEPGVARARRLMECLMEPFEQEDSRNAELVRRAITDGRTYRLFGINTRSEMEPTDQNRVFLLDERDRSGLFRPAARLVFGARDLENVEASLRLLGETLIGSGLGRVRIVNDEIYLRCTGGGHIMGTTRMGDDPKTSVVDLNCRVHGYANFFVAGSSVFTTSGAANPTLTIVALALRLGEHLRRA